MVVQLHDVGVVELVHNFDFELDLLHKLVLNDLCFVYHFDRIDFLRNLVPHFVYFSKATDTNVGVGKRLKIVSAAFTLLARHNRRRQKENPVLHRVHLGFELGWHFDRCDLLTFLGHNLNST